MKVKSALIGNILTRTTGYLETVSSHSAQPYRGCSLGRSLCGVGCYVRHNHYLTRGQEWGTFLEARENAGESYLENCRAESRWARKHRGSFSIFLSSSTEPFVPQESRCGVTRALLSAMAEAPPDALIIQTHSHLVLDHLCQLQALGERCVLRVQVSIETDREELPGLPAFFSSIDSRFDAARRLREAAQRYVDAAVPRGPLVLGRGRTGGVFAGRRAERWVSPRRPGRFHSSDESDLRAAAIDL